MHILIIALLSCSIAYGAQPAHDRTACEAEAERFRALPIAEKVKYFRGYFRNLRTDVPYTQKRYTKFFREAECEYMAQSISAGILVFANHAFLAAFTKKDAKKAKSAEEKEELLQKFHRWELVHNWKVQVTPPSASSTASTSSTDSKSNG